MEEPGAGSGGSVCGLVAHGARGQGRGGGGAWDVENLGLPSAACLPSNEIFVIWNSAVLVALLCLDSVVAAKDRSSEEADDDELGDDHGGAQGTVRAVEPVTAYM